MAKRKRLSGTNSVVVVAGELQASVSLLASITKQKSTVGFHRDVFLWTRDGELWASASCPWGYVALCVCAVSTTIPQTAINAAHLQRSLNAFDKGDALTLGVGDMIELSANARSVHIPLLSCDARDYARPSRGALLHSCSMDEQMFADVFRSLSPIVVSAQNGGHPKLQFVWSWPTTCSKDAWIACDGHRAVAFLPPGTTLVSPKLLPPQGPYGISHEAAKTLCGLLDLTRPTSPVGVQIEERRVTYEGQKFVLMTQVETEPPNIYDVITRCRDDIERGKTAFTLTEEVSKSIRVCSRVSTTDKCSLNFADDCIKVSSQANDNLIAFEELVPVTFSCTRKPMVQLGTRYLLDIIAGHPGGEFSFNENSVFYRAEHGFHEYLHICMGRKS